MADYQAKITMASADTNTYGDFTINGFQSTFMAGEVAKWMVDGIHANVPDADVSFEVVRILHAGEVKLHSYGPSLDGPGSIEVAAPAPSAEPYWLTVEVVGLAACQFGTSVRHPEPMYDEIHLVRESKTGTPGPTLCGIDRFAKDGPGWGMGIGYVRTGATPTGCSACAVEAAEKFHGVPIHGLHKYVDIFAVEPFEVAS